MSRLLQLRDAIVGQIQTAIPGADVAGHLGRFTEEELRTFMIASAKSGCGIRVAVLGLSKPVKVSDEGVDYEAIIGIYVATRDGAGRLSRDEAAVSAVETIVILCDRTRWGLPFVKVSDIPPTAQNLYNAKALADGQALWAIDLRQPIRIAAAPADPGGPLAGLWLGLAPDIGPPHVADYVQFPDEAA